MDTLKDIWASLSSGLKDRTTNPLTVAFVLSWSLWNFKFFVILFGDGTTKEKLSTIEGIYPHTFSTYMGGALLLPTATALVYVFLYPYVSEKVIKTYRRHQVRISNAIREVELTRVITKEEATALTRRHENERKKWEEAESSLESQLGELRAALAASEQQNHDLRTKQAGAPTKPMLDLKDLEPAPDAIKEEQEEVTPPETSDEPTSSNKKQQLENNELSRYKRVLITMSNEAAGLFAKDLAAKFQENYSITLLTLEEMAARDLVAKSSMGRWSLTPKGRKAAVAILTP